MLVLVAAAAVTLVAWEARVWLVLGVEGVQAGLVVAAAAGWGAWPVRWLGQGRRPPLQQFCLAAGLGFGVLSTLTLCLGVTGTLTRVTAWALITAGATGGLLRLRQRTVSQHASPPRASAAGQGGVDAETPHILAGRSAALLPLVVPLVLGLLGASLAPGILWLDENKAYDALEYHLQGPREYYEAGRVHFLPHNVYASFPQQVETLFLLCMHLAGGVYAGAIPAQLLHALHGILAVLALAAWAETRWSRVVVAVVAGTTPWLAHLACLAYVELGVLLFAALAGGLLLDSVRRREALTWRTVLAAGLLAGLAGGCKYTALVLVAAALGIAWAVILLWVGSSAGWSGCPARQAAGTGGGRRGAAGGEGGHDEAAGGKRPEWRPLPRILLCAVYAGGVLAAFSPWLIRNAAFAGNPVYPFAYEWFGGRAWSAEQAEQWRRGHVVPADRSGLAGRSRAVWHELVAAPKFGPALFVVAALALLVRRDRSAAFLGIWLALLVLAWAGLTHMPGRFVVPALVPLTLAIGALPIGRVGRGRPRSVAAAVIPLALLGGLWNDVVLVRLWRDDAAFWARYGASLPFFLGATELYARELEPLNRITPPDARLWLIGEARTFYVDRDVHYTVVFSRDPWLQYAAAASPDEAVDWLRREKVTHVLFSWTEIDRLARSYGFEAFVTRAWARRLESAGLERVDVDSVDSRDVTLYRVPRG